MVLFLCYVTYYVKIDGRKYVKLRLCSKSLSCRGRGREMKERERARVTLSSPRIEGLRISQLCTLIFPCHSAVSFSLLSDLLVSGASKRGGQLRSKSISPPFPLMRDFYPRLEHTLKGLICSILLRRVTAC